MIVKINNIYNIDCLEGMSKIKSESVDLVFFDPPFNLSKDYGKGISDDMKKKDYLDWQYKLIDEAKRIIKPTGAIVYHNIPKWAFKIANYMDEAGLMFQNWVAWSESGSMPTPSRLYPKHYPILWFTKTKKKTFNKHYTPVERCRKCDSTIKDYGGKYKNLKEIDGEKVTVLSDVWDDIHRVRHRKNMNRTANELPELLMERIINMYTNEGDIVLDPFMGGGTTAKVSALLGRFYIGFEISSENTKIANNRVSEYLSKHKWLEIAVCKVSN